MTWLLKGGVPGVAENEIEVTADLPELSGGFMLASTMEGHRALARKWGGEANGERAAIVHTTSYVGGAMEEYRPGALAWCEEHGPWHAEPCYDPTKRESVILGGKARIVFKDKATALLFKLTWA